ncbi:MAG: hypothetical protein RQ833_11700 [Sphingomonadaceae bacterium]|nr:hypothetical protein [Sphingomonadaceae bacterium]
MSYPEPEFDRDGDLIVCGEDLGYAHPVDDGYRLHGFVQPPKDGEDAVAYLVIEGTPPDADWTPATVALKLEERRLSELIDQLEELREAVVNASAQPSAPAGELVL